MQVAGQKTENLFTNGYGVERVFREGTIPSGFHSAQRLLTSPFGRCGRVKVRYVYPTRQGKIAKTPINIEDLWRRRVGVEPTIRPAKDRIAGFEGREGHRTLFASAFILNQVGTLS
jgi:hypothetical protein